LKYHAIFTHFLQNLREFRCLRLMRGDGIPRSLLLRLLPAKPLSVPLRLSTIWRYLPTSTLGAPANPSTIRVRPSDAGWPDAASWEKLSHAVGGRLLKMESPLDACKGGADPAQADRRLSRSVAFLFRQFVANLAARRVERSVECYRRMSRNESTSAMHSNPFIRRRYRQNV
jgi:hypothetical protein